MYNIDSALNALLTHVYIYTLYIYLYIQHRPNLRLKAALELLNIPGRSLGPNSLGLPRPSAAPFVWSWGMMGRINK